MASGRGVGKEFHLAKREKLWYSVDGADDGLSLQSMSKSEQLHKEALL